MNIPSKTPDLPFPYWSKGRIFPYHFEMKPALIFDPEGWRHPDQEGLVPRPDGHAIISALENGSLLNRVIGLKTLMHCKDFPDQRPHVFRQIYMFGLLDIVEGPYAGNLFVPCLTPINAKGSFIHWMNLKSGFNCLDRVPLRCLI